MKINPRQKGGVLYIFTVFMIKVSFKNNGLILA